ncbi:MAG: sugar kinase [Haloarculaceae archaeon]
MTGVRDAAPAGAFVPGHAAGFATVDRHDDPTKAGARGAGLALSDGVTVTVHPAEERSVELDGEPVELGAVERVLDTLEAHVAVRGTSDLARGAGLGVSGGMALGAALATNRALDRGLSANELVTIAHGAEIQAGTGRGDVVGAARGGAPVRLEPGGPHENVVDAVPEPARVEYRVLGESGVTAPGGGEDLTAAGERALSAVVRDPTLATFMEASRGFVRETGLLTDRARAVVEDVAAAGGSATMAVRGETVLALGSGLSDAGYDAAACRLHPGATVEEPDA